jgi:hypothetical protein
LRAHFLRTSAGIEQDLRNFSASAVSSRVLNPSAGVMRLTGAMNNTPPSHRASPLRLLRGAVVIAALSAVSSPLFAQNTNATDDARRKRGDGNGGDRGNFNPQDMQARMLAGLRERLEVTDDEEWKLISERLTKVLELRRSTAGGTFGAFSAMGGRGPQGGDSGRSSRGSTSRTGGNTELTALASAVKDKLPDAEIKARLDRVRELRKENEAKLAKAQEELRAVLSVRQEAFAVVAGFLP